MQRTVVVSGRSRRSAHAADCPAVRARARVLEASAATIDRLLKSARAGVRKRVARRSGAALIRRQVPVRTFGDWNDPSPGYMEGDLVAHCGDQASGSFVYTLSLTDICSGWTECVPLVVRQAVLVTEALEQLQATMPFPLRGFDSDNGSEFLNETMIAYCRERNIEFTRSRPYRKNDQAWIEQKNGAVVRRLVGYGRLEGLAAAEALARLYAASRLFVNSFSLHSMATKTRVGARVSKTYHAPETPCARLLASTQVEDVIKDRLRSAQHTLDPLRCSVKSARCNITSQCWLTGKSRTFLQTTISRTVQKFWRLLGGRRGSTDSSR